MDPQYFQEKVQYFAKGFLDMRHSQAKMGNIFEAKSVKIGIFLSAKIASEMVMVWRLWLCLNQVRIISRNSEHLLNTG